MLLRFNIKLNSQSDYKFSSYFRLFKNIILVTGLQFEKQKIIDI